ncbi:MAG: hypothetical protein E3J72_12635 [Planctomycetota bacterium]|nr:MAG: hypothetical protein E3J72_12635 [Planctomycetota bacterium]
MQSSKNNILLVVLLTLALVCGQSEIASAASPSNKESSKTKKVTPKVLNKLPAGNTRYEVEVHVKRIVGSIFIAQELSRRALFTTRSLLGRSKSLETGNRLLLRGYLGRRSGRIVFFIEHFEKLETDFERFEAAIAALKPDDGAGRIKLAEEALDLAEKSRDAELETTAKNVLAEGITIEEENADRNKPEELIRVAQLYAEKLAEEEHAFRLLNEVLKKKPEHAGAIAAFRKLGAHFHNGRWISREAFMIAEGLVLEGDEWIQPEEREFREAIMERKNELVTDRFGSQRLRMFTEKVYNLTVTEHGILIGMTRQEVADSLGFPEGVERSIVDGRTYDQWIYRDVYIYFENGQVFRKEKPK